MGGRRPAHWGCGVTRRLEITVSEETWAALDAARGHEPRASFVKRALDSALRSRPSVHIEGFGSVPADAGQTISAAREAGRALTPDPDRSRPLAPKPVPGVRPAREVLREGVNMDRQARVNALRSKRK